MSDTEMEVDTPPADTSQDKDASQEGQKDKGTDPTPMDQGPKDPNDEVRDEDGGIHVDGIYIPPPPLPALTFDSTEPRLVITHIDNYNFKSYYGPVKLGPFHKAFTSIIGPNGSGKSNVIDSMLFVFGYRAQKIRNKKLSGLIHQSAGRQNIYECSVEVHFCSIIDDCDDPDKYEIVPNSEFIVSRTAYRDNSSSYSINGVKSTFKEVGKMLRQKGIDLDHNRFLILQGEVEQISMMKPKGDNPNDEGMLEYLEDIIGSSRL